MPRIILSLLLLFTLCLTPALAQVAPRVALARRIPEVSFSGTALSDAIEYLADASRANIHVNWRALESTGVAKDTPVNLRLRNAPLRKVLALVLTDAAGGSGTLSFYSAEGVIHITTRELADSDLITRIYPVQDLLVEVPDFDNAPDFNLQQSAQVGGGGGGGSLFGGGGGGESEKGTTRAERAQQLIDLIVDTVQPDVWAVNGGPATIRYFNGNLIVRAPRSVHEVLGFSSD
ncbi:MAG: hypothetical protein NZ561_05855 [Phycisphaerae bacterium]|nr:hypothetical protein [Phycisphaerae bacterium]MDW8261509.1 hypothetical protein [Phycisphaerales bacterium]